MKSYDEFITEVAHLWLEMLRADAPKEVIEKFSEDELKALAEYMTKATFRLYGRGVIQGYEESVLDNLLESGIGKET